MKQMYNVKLQNLRLNLATNINKIQHSNQNIKRKKILLNNLINQHSNAVVGLTKSFNNDITSIKKQLKPLLLETPTQTQTNKKKTALLIGINYFGTENQLYGCINDVNNIYERLKNQGVENNNIIILIEEKATRENIINELTNLLLNSQPNDLLFLMYSGHGTNDVDKNGDEIVNEIGRNDQCVVPYDFLTNGLILDDELKSIIQKHLKSNVTLFAMFDCCHSGTILDLRYQYFDSIHYDQFTENVKELVTPGNVFMISGCNDLQTSIDSFINNEASGAMTWSLLESLKQMPQCSWRELVINMRDLLKQSHYEQIPQFSCGQIENIDLPVFI